MKNKKGSHVGLILSFVVFVTFLFFVFSILNPAVKEQKSKQLALELLKEKIFERITSEVSITSLKINNNTNYSKLDGTLFNCFEIDEFLTGKNISLLDEEGNKTPGNTDGSKIKVIHNSKKFFRIIHSLEFDKEEVVDTPCLMLSSENYTLGSTRTDKNPFESKINSLLEEYLTNYTLLKNKFEISSEDSFGFSFINSSGDEIQRGFQEVSGNVYIEKIPIQYYNLNAEIKSGDITLRIW